MKKIILAAAAALFSMSRPAVADPLDTGFNHGNANYYLVGQQDNYWIKIASYEPPTSSVPVAAAFVLNPAIATWGPVPTARWIGPRNTPFSSGGTNVGNPAYSIFRKCFCLLANYTNPQLSIRVRGDDNIHVWLNTVTNTLIAPVMGNYFTNQGPPLAYPQPPLNSNPGFFRRGRNCLYVLVEDYLGHIGFSLSGTVNAAGLMPGMAFGPEGSFGPCGCPGETGQGGATPTGSPAGSPVSDDDAAVVQEIIQFAETRRLRAMAQRRQAAGAGNGPGMAR